MGGPCLFPPPLPPPSSPCFPSAGLALHPSMGMLTLPLFSVFRGGGPGSSPCLLGGGVNPLLYWGGDYFSPSAGPGHCCVPILRGPEPYLCGVPIPNLGQIPVLGEGASTLG